MKSSVNKLSSKLDDLQGKVLVGWMALSRWKRWGALGALVLILLPMALYGWFWWFFQAKIYPGVSVAGVEVGSLSRQEAVVKLQSKVGEFEESLPAELVFDQQSWQILWIESGLEFEVTELVAEAYRVGRLGGWLGNAKEQYGLLTQGKNLPLRFGYKATWLENLLTEIESSVAKPMIPGRLEMIRDGSNNVVDLEFVDSEDGRRLVKEDLVKNWSSSLSFLKPLNNELKMETVRWKVNDDSVETALKRGRSLLGKQIVLTYENDGYEDRSWQMNDEAILTFISFEESYDRMKIADYLQEVAEVVNRPARDAVFEFDPELNRVMEFAASRDGIEVDVAVTADRLVRGLETLESTEDEVVTHLSVKVSEPAVTLENVNDLGVVELLGRGESYFRGSIPSRVHNVSLGAARIHGTLVPPGEVFSFNQAIGSISQATGFQAAYIIQDGRTVLGDGGGVCQDSTTVFRAALDAGLPIVERRAHSYRVGYYEQDAKPGLDASVFAPYSDLKFKNDTPAHILVQTRTDTTNLHLVVEIYGTSDGRASEILNHTVWDVSPPPPDVWVDDPTLAPGVVRQVDWQAWGAKAKFDYVVRRGDEVIHEKTFNSNFRPWAAVYLRGV